MSNETITLQTLAQLRAELKQAENAVDRIIEQDLWNARERVRVLKREIKTRERKEKEYINELS